MKDYPFTNQNSKKRPQSKEWSEIRAEMMMLKQQLNLADDEFRALSPYENHKAIEEQIYQQFCNLTNSNTRPVWLWTCFKQPEYAVSDLPKRPECYLNELINPNESIWVGALGMAGGRDKIWLYECKIKAIQKVLSESCFFDEFYFVSKKYEWLFCINHHDVLIATGGDMPNKLKALYEKKA